MGYESLSTVIVLVIVVLMLAVWLPRRDGQRYETCDGASRGPVFLVAASGGRRQRDQVLGRAHAAGERGNHAAKPAAQGHVGGGAYRTGTAYAPRGRASPRRHRGRAGGGHGRRHRPGGCPAFQPAVRADSRRTAAGGAGTGCQRPPATRARGERKVAERRARRSQAKPVQPVVQARERDASAAPTEARWSSGRSAGRCGSRRRRRPASRRAVRPAMPTWWMSIRWWSRSAPTTTASSRSGMTFGATIPPHAEAPYTRERAGGAGRCHH